MWEPPKKNEWIPFEGKPFGAAGHLGARVTLSPRHVIYLNKKAFAALGEPEAVEFLFNPATESIGLRPANPRLESAFPVKPKVIQGLHSGYVIHASAFMVDIKIHPARTIQFNKITVDSKGLMTLPLESITAIARGAR